MHLLLGQTRALYAVGIPQIQTHVGSPAKGNGLALIGDRGGLSSEHLGISELGRCGLYETGGSLSIALRSIMTQSSS